MFLDLRVHSLNSTGTDSPSRMEREARERGVEVAFCDGVEYEDAISGIELEARGKKELKKKIGASRGFDIIFVHGGKANINRHAASDDRVDVLTHPWLDRRDSGVDSIVAREAADNNVAIEFCLDHLMLRNRIKVLSHMRRILKLREKYNFNIIATSGARNRYALRNKLEVKAVLRLIGMGEEDVREVLQLPRKIAEERIK